MKYRCPILLLLLLTASKLLGQSETFPDSLIRAAGVKTVCMSRTCANCTEAELAHSFTTLPLNHFSVRCPRTSIK